MATDSRSGPSIAVAVLVALLVALAGIPGPAGATPAPRADPVVTDDDSARVEALGLDVTVGYAGQGGSGGWVPVAVSLAPERAVVASVEVTARTLGGEQTRQRAIELRAGAQATYRFVLPEGPVRVVVIGDDGTETNAEIPPPESVDAPIVVGLLGEVGQPPPLAHPVLSTSATSAAVDPAWLAFGTPALDPLSGVIVTTATLAELDPIARRALAAGVANGLDLAVVATTPGAVALDGIADDVAVTVADAPDPQSVGTVEVDGPAWRTAVADVVADSDDRGTAAVTVPAGRGRIHVTAVQPGQGGVADTGRLWSLLTLGRVQTLDEESFDATPNASAAVMADALSDGADRAADLPWLALFLVVYIVVVGPLTAVLLARARRRELAWVAVPAVALVFTLAAFVGVAGVRPQQQHDATVQWWLDGTGEQVAVSAVQSPSAGTADVTLPGHGWQIETVADGPDGATIRTAGADTVAGLSSRSLSIAGVVAHRPLAEAPPLQVDASVVDGTVAVDVTNTGPDRLIDVEVSVGMARRPIGTLKPGASAQRGFGPETLPATPLWSSTTQRPDGTVPITAVLSGGVMAPEPGIAWAVGTVAQNTAVASDRASSGRLDATSTMVVGTRPRIPGGTTVHPQLVDRTPVGRGMRAGVSAIEGTDTAVRFRLPPGIVGDTLGDQLGAGQPMQVWDWQAGSWIPRDEAFDDGAGDPRRLVSPTGEVYVRKGVDGTFDFSQRSFGSAEVDA